MTDTRPGIFLGTQGFSFKDWVGPFYPAGTAARGYLEAYARHFDSVEIDSTFYGIPRANVVAGWRQRTPAEFVFSAKFPKLITHEKKLADARGDAEAFIGTMSALGDKLGVLTLQFAYDFTPDHFSRLDAFLGDLPEGYRYAVEVRNRMWIEPQFAEMLHGHNVALVLQDLNYMPRLDWLTADFTVVRWLGRRKDIREFDRIQIDRSAVLQDWAAKVFLFIQEGVDLYGYFNNHFAGHSPASVRQFAEMIGQPIPWPDDNAVSGTQLRMEP